MRDVCCVLLLRFRPAILIGIANIKVNEQWEKHGATGVEMMS